MPTARARCADLIRRQPGLERAGGRAIRARRRRCGAFLLRAAGSGRRHRGDGNGGGRGGQHRHRRRRRHSLPRRHPPSPQARCRARGEPESHQARRNARRGRSRPPARCARAQRQCLGQDRRIEHRLRGRDAYRRRAAADRLGPHPHQRGIGRRRDGATRAHRARTRGAIRPSRTRRRRRRGARAPLSPRRPGAASGVATIAGAAVGRFRMKQDNIGIAVVGAGRIGTLRARLAAKHPAVRFLAISDRDPARARALAAEAGADVHSGSNDEVISHPQVTAVIVSTPEQQHTLPILKALQLGKPVLVEKPIGFSLREADKILDTLRVTEGELRVGYSRRYKECFLRAKEQMLRGRIGKVVGGMARVYNSRAQAFAILKRDPHATPVLDVLTYYVDLMCWFLEGNRPVEVVARGQHGIFKNAGYGAHDVTWAILTFADGAVINLGVSYALPARYPTLGQSDRVELLGSDGTMIIDDDHLDHLLFSEKGIPHAYVPAHTVDMAFLGSNTAGDWAVGDFWGPLGNETRAWLDHLATGAPTIHTTPEQARINLETTIAIERAAASGQTVRLPLQMEE